MVVMMKPKDRDCLQVRFMGRCRHKLQDRPAGVCDN